MAKDTTNKKRYSPAYYRYRENHPIISLVLTKDLKKFLDSQIRDTGMSYSQLMKKFIEQAYDLAQARTKGYEEGYAEGLNEGENKLARERNKYRIIALGECSCGKPLLFDLDNPEDLRILSQIVSDVGLVHKGCKSKLIVMRVGSIEPKNHHQK